MRVYVNAKTSDAPFGGANSFLRALFTELRRRGLELTDDPLARVDVAFLNALTEGITAADARTFHERGIPVVHRRVGYVVSGSPEMRALVDGVVHGDRLQLDFDPYVRLVVFQSEYSRDVFVQSGFRGSFEVIHNGTDSTVFGVYGRPLGFLPPRRRRYWDGRQPFRFAVSTWSRDMRKGFDWFARFDETLANLPGVSIDLVGRVPEGMRFRHITVHEPVPARRLASFLRRCHGLLAFSESETCSNALIEGINCGLQPIYLDSGSNAELAAAFGVRFDGDFTAAVQELLDGYASRRATAPEHPYDIRPVADRYVDVLQRVVAAG